MGKLYLKQALKKYLKDNDKVKLYTLLEVVKLKKDIFKIAGRSLKSRFRNRKI